MVKNCKGLVLAVPLVGFVGCFGLFKAHLVRLSPLQKVLWGQEVGTN